MKFFGILATCGLVWSTAGCGPTKTTHNPTTEANMNLSVSDFGKTPDGQKVELYTLKNKNGMEMRVMTYGATVTHLMMPNPDGTSTDVVLGFDTLEPYFDKSPYFGCAVGRYGNRIAKGKFSLNEKDYVLATNNDPNHLHGGTQGFDKRVWSATAVDTESGPSVVFSLVSKDGDQGYPGTLHVTMTYTLTEDNAFTIDYSAKTDAPTIVNLTNHSYFNLAGKGDILGHLMTINADTITAIDETFIPTGDLMPLEGTPFDFRTPRPIGERIDHDHEQIKNGLGYDHNYVVNRDDSDGLVSAATVTDPDSGRTLEILTSEPGIQLYSGNFLDGIAGKAGNTYIKRSGFCLETQHFPDSPNQPDFPSTRLDPGAIYTSSTEHRFSIK